MNSFLGEIRMFGGDFAPKGWALCHGQHLPISANKDLFALIGKAYGGDGQTTFALPDLRGRVPVHQGTGYALASKGGTEQVELNADHLPVHTHTLSVSARPASTVRKGSLLAPAPDESFTSQKSPLTRLGHQAVTTVGGSQSHDNMQPFRCINYIISLQGVSPTAYPAPTSMAPFIGEIRPVAFSYAPPDWELCTGQFLKIDSYPDLFKVLGTTYGGASRAICDIFGIPNLQGVIAVGAGQGTGLTNRRLNDAGGSAEVTLTTSQLPSHSHYLCTSLQRAGTPKPGEQLLATGPVLYALASTLEPMHPSALAPAGGSQPHNNMMPYQTMFFIIATQGEMPIRS